MPAAHEAGGHHSLPAPLTEEIDLGQIDDFLAAPAQHGLEHEETEAGHLIELDRGRHGQLLPVDENLDEGGSVMTESMRDHRPNLFGCFRCNPMSPCQPSPLRVSK